MRALAAILAALACACATQHVTDVSPVAVVVEYANVIKPLGRQPQIYRLVASQVHALTLVTSLNDIHEDDFAAVIVLKRGGNMFSERSYDVDETDRAKHTGYTIPYEVRREGRVTRSGALAVSFASRDFEGGTAKITNMASLLRDLASD